VVKIPNITGLRFFLAIIVIIFHLPSFSSKHGIPFYDLLPIFHKGTESVYMFFSLSGFLIIRQLYVEKSKSNTISLKNFFLRRSLRIFPLYFLILFFGLIYYNYILPKFGFVGGYNTNYNIVEALLLSIFFMPNVFANLYSPGGIIETLWSIGVEEQFYLFIAPILLCVPIKKHICFLVLFTITFFLFFFYVEGNIFSKYGMSFFYFTSSGLTSLLLLKKQFLLKNRILKFITLVIFILYFATNIFSDLFSGMSYHFLSMILFSGVIGILSFRPFLILNNKRITYLGKISYGIYMYHSVVLQFIGFVYLKIFSKLGLNNLLIVVFYNLLVILITIVISHFSYQYFEKNFMKMYNKTNTSTKNLFQNL
jgi:peptidoglycan/LPS O-acetylase OafA/YrhL